MLEILHEEILEVKSIAEQIIFMKIKSKVISHSAKPGQFVNVRCGDGVNSLLRRPISICSIDKEKETFDIAFQIKGEGTVSLAKYKPGEKVDLLGPLGTPFHISDEYKRIAVVGGGIGVFPLLFLLKTIKNSCKAAYLGFRSTNQIALKDEFAANSQELIISTDDGSFGESGLIINPFIEGFNQNTYDIIYTCGPTPLLKAVSEFAGSQKVPCQVSMEQRMGCGIGACLVCACKTKSNDGDDWKYSHVCKDGPVFWSQDIIFD